MSNLWLFSARLLLCDGNGWCDISEEIKWGVECFLGIKPPRWLYIYDHHCILSPHHRLKIQKIITKIFLLMSSQRAKIDCEHLTVDKIVFHTLGNENEKLWKVSNRFLMFPTATITKRSGFYCFEGDFTSTS